MMLMHIKLATCTQKKIKQNKLYILKNYSLQNAAAKKNEVLTAIVTIAIIHYDMGVGDGPFDSTPMGS